MPQLQICLVSEQLAPNLIPALKLRPQRVILLASAPMRKRAELLRSVLKSHEFAVEIYGQALADHHIARIREQAEHFNYALIDPETARSVGIKPVEPGTEILFNATGGNKLMALVWQQALAGNINGVMYCDTQHQSLEWLVDQRTDTPRTPAEPLEQVLNLSDILAANDHRTAPSDRHGHKAGLPAGAPGRKSLTRFLAENLAPDPTLLGKLNRSGAEATIAFERDNPQGRRQSFDRNLHGRWAQVIDRICAPEHALAQHDAEKGQLEFLSLEAGRYLSGGWLEEFAYWSACDCAPHQAEANVIVKARNGETLNELDAVVVHNNRMLLMECKCGLLDEQDVLHKLQNLSSQTGGAFAQAWLVAARKPPAHITDRASHYRIRVVGPEQLPRLKDHIRDWMRLNDA